MASSRPLKVFILIDGPYSPFFCSWFLSCKPCKQHVLPCQQKTAPGFEYIFLKNIVNDLFFTMISPSYGYVSRPHGNY